jgi:hypothetical protein
MSDTNTRESIRAVRDDAIRLVGECRGVVEIAHKIVETLGGGVTAFDAISQKKQGPWKQRLVLFADSIVELSGYLDTSAVPSEALLEQMEAGQSVVEVASVPGASRVRLAHDLANRVLNALTAPLDAVSSFANKSRLQLSPGDIAMAVKWAKQIATVEEFTKKEASLLVAGIRSETAEAMTGAAPEGVGPEPAAMHAPPGLPDAKSGTKPPVQLFGVNVPARVLNGRLRIETTGQYNVVQTLINAYPNRLTKSVLGVKSGHPDAVNILKRLRKKHKSWERVIHLAGVAGGGYALVWP